MAVQICHETELQVLRALAVALGISEDHLVPYHNGHDNQLRLLHYPRFVFSAWRDKYQLAERLYGFHSVLGEELEQEKAARIGAHSDFGSITLLLQDDVGGLEVEDPNQPGVFNVRVWLYATSRMLC